MPEIEVTPEHAADPNSRRVGVLVGVVGIFLSVVTIASHRAHTKAVIYRTEANDDWSYYQAKKIRENTNDVASIVLESLAADPAGVAGPVQKLEAARKKYSDDAQELQTAARSGEAKNEKEEKRALRFDVGEGPLELGLVLGFWGWLL